jgi:hypothetical protein
MRTGLLEAIVRGDRQVWSVFGVLWLATTVLVLLQRSDARARIGRLLAIASLAAATSIAGLALASAVSLPRVVFRSVDEPALIEPPGTDASRSGPDGDTWHKLRGPAVVAIIDGAPDIAVPTIDAEGRWVLYGLLGARAVPGLPPAAAVPPESGGARLCSNGVEPCRAWPAAWPDPARVPSFGDLVWSRDASMGALAYDVDSGEFLRGTSSGPGGPALDVAGRMNAEPPREGTSALFMLRRVFRGRLDAMRIVSAATPSGRRFLVQRASVSLDLAPRLVRFVGRPLLVAGALGLPLTIAAYLLAPMLFAAVLRRHGAVRHALDRELVVVPVTGAGAGSGAVAVVDAEATLGDRPLGRGAVVPLAMSDGRRIASTTWLELPARAETKGRAEGGDEPYRNAPKVGPLVPADAEPFGRIARAWACRRAMPLVVLAAGIASAVPGVVAIVGLFAGR